MNQAIDKLRDEMAHKSDNQPLQVIGEYMTTYLMTHAKAAAAIEAEGKTLEGALKAAKEAARGKASGGVAMVPETEVYANVLKYYGLAGEKQKTADVCGFGLDLDDLLGE